MNSDEIEKYLAELGTELKNRGIKKPVRLMLIGGTYMLLLANAPRSTNDIDVFWLEEDAFQQTLNPDWFNYVAQLLMYDGIIVPNGKLRKRFGPLHIHIPTREYILALKITAGRDKDLEDCAILLSQTTIKTRQQARQLLNQYILPEGQEKNAEQIENSLDQLFEERY